MVVCPDFHTALILWALHIEFCVPSPGPDSLSVYKVLSILNLYRGATEHAGPNDSNTVNLGGRVNAGSL